jgi:hypothetical protein
MKTAFYRPRWSNAIKRPRQERLIGVDCLRRAADHGDLMPSSANAFRRMSSGASAGRTVRHAMRRESLRLAEPH